jgi:hypothetical protein
MLSFVHCEQRQLWIFLFVRRELLSQRHIFVRESDMYLQSSYTNSKQRCEAVVQRLRGEYAEELYIPLAAVSQSTLQYFTSLPVGLLSQCLLHSFAELTFQIGRDFLIFDKSEFLHHDAPVHMRPGKHGYFVPCSWSLLGLINLHIQSRQRGCHVFISSGEQGAMYHGYYQIQQGDVELTRYEWACFPRRVSFASV